jgi:hypothetical protein
MFQRVTMKCDAGSCECTIGVERGGQPGGRGNRLAAEQPREPILGRRLGLRLARLVLNDQLGAVLAGENAAYPGGSISGGVVA